MLSLDPQFRCLRGWEQAQPVPPPLPAEEAHDPRRPAFVRLHEQRSAEQKAMHIFEVDATMEDTEILGMAFHGQQMTLPVAGYRTVVARRRSDRDLPNTTVGWSSCSGSRRPPELWLFKAPHHKFHLEALSRAYPEMPAS